MSRPYQLWSVGQVRSEARAFAPVP